MTQLPDNALEELRSTVKPIAALAEDSLEQAIKPVLDQLWAGLAKLQFPELDLSIFSHIGQQVLELQHRMAPVFERIAPLFENLAQSFRELPPRTQHALLLLGTHGWYLDLQMSLPSLWRLQEALTDGDVARTERTLCRYFTRRLSEIEDALCSRFPHRSRIIGLAFKAHRRREYELSVPVLLAQTDGICKEMIGRYYFMGKNGKPGTATYVKQIAGDSLLAAFLSPLAQTLPIGASQRDRSEASEILNRHTVLHGDSLTYGTRESSLKTVSLINYVSQVLDWPR